MPSFCAVVGCANSAAKTTNISYYRIPPLLKIGSDKKKELSKIRRDKWIQALKREDLTETKLKYGRVCSVHFISGKPADLEDENHPDWVPSVNMGCTTRPQAKSSHRYARTTHRTKRKALKIPIMESPFKHHFIKTEDPTFCFDSLQAYRCYSCDFEAALKVVLTNHTNLVHGGMQVATFVTTDRKHAIQSYECENCDFQTFSQLVLLQHVNSCNNESVIRLLECVINGRRWFKCDHCDFKTRFRSAFERHMLRKHNESFAYWLKCGYCRFQTLYKGCMEEHKSSKHTKKTIKCEFCDYQTFVASSLKGHIISRHTDEQDINWFKCEHCEHKFKLKCTLRKHVMSQHTDPQYIKWYYCQHCAYKCKDGGSLRKHLRVMHTNPEDIQWINCEQCPYKAKGKKLLKIHLLESHTDSKYLFQCEYCSHKSKYKYSLNRHVLTKHSNVKADTLVQA